MLDNNNDFLSLLAELDEDMAIFITILTERIMDNSQNRQTRFPKSGLNHSLGRKRVRSPGVITQSKNKKQEIGSELSTHNEIPVNELFLTKV